MCREAIEFDTQKTSRPTDLIHCNATAFEAWTLAIVSFVFTAMANEEVLSFDFPNLNDLDLAELSYDSSSTVSSDCSPLNSPALSPVYSPTPSTSSSSASPLPPAASPELPNLSQKPSPRKHRSRCSTPQCTKKEHASVLRRNERERNRVKLVSDGFTTLRKHVPTNPSNKKLSKVETLRTAIEYIKHLQRLLNESKRLERQKRMLTQGGWLQEAYSLQVRFCELLNPIYITFVTC